MMLEQVLLSNMDGRWWKPAQWDKSFNNHPTTIRQC